MSGYIEAGYIACLGSLSIYSASLYRRERAARTRLKRPQTSGRDGSLADADATDVMREEMTTR